MLNKLEQFEAQIIFYGQEKPRDSNEETSENEASRYDHAMKQLIQRINWSIPEDQHHLMILDKQGPKERKFQKMLFEECTSNDSQRPHQTKS